MSLGHGGRRAGAGRPQGALNRLTRPVKELAADQSEACIQRLIALRDYAKSEQVQFAACKELLDRGCGRPRQEIAVEDKSLTIVINKLTPQPDATPPVTVAGTLIDHSGNGTDGSAN